MSEIPGGPYDVEFFFDPSCPFAWQASVWLRRVAELRDVGIGWRFISLKMVNEDDDDQAPELLDAHRRSHEYLRVCAAARERFGNDVVGHLYKRWGESYWYVEADGEFGERLEVGAREADVPAILALLGLPDDLLDAAAETSYDDLIRAETEEAFERAGDGVGTPIITYDPPHGNSLFGPVISSVPDDERAVAFYDALRTMADFPAFSELKRTRRPPLDLPLLAS